MINVSPMTRAWPHYANDEVEAAVSVLRSGKVNYWTGQEGRKFEKEFADLFKVRYAVAVSNGTAALELALYALGIGPGDEVIVPSRSFIASASAVVNCGARPVFADIDRNSQNVTVGTLQAVVTPRTRAAVVVHLAGWPCDMDSIMDFARDHGLLIVEDCAQAHGASYRGRPVGSFGDAAAFSFCQDKIISTGGEGGMMVTNREDVWRRAWAYKDHGKSFDAVYHEHQAPGFKWLHHSIGTNWRMTEMQAAIGRVQLQKLSLWHKRRARNAGILTSALRNLPALRVPVPPGHVTHAYYRYGVFVRPERLKSNWNRDRIIADINTHGVPCFSGICPEIYLEKAFTDRGLAPSRRWPVAKELGQTSMTFLVHSTLGDKDMEFAAAVVKSVMQQATKSVHPWVRHMKVHSGYGTGRK